MMPPTGTLKAADETALVTPASCACGGQSFEEVLRFPRIPPCDAYQRDRARALALAAYPIDLYRCAACGLIQLRPVVRPDILYSNYIYTTASSPGLAAHFDEYADVMVGRLGLTDADLAVDIGCNDGTLLKSLKRRSVRVLGVEPSPIGAQAREDARAPVVSEYFSRTLAEKIRREHGAASLVTANNVLANILDLADFLEGIPVLMAPNGVFVFETFYFPDLLRNVVVEMINHEHYYYFTVGALRTLLGRFGLRLVAASRIATKGGSIRCVAVQETSGSEVDRESELEDLIESEKNIGLQFFQSRRRTAWHSVGELLKTAAAQGGRIAGFGAAAGTTILLYCADVASKIEVLADDNAGRHGMFAPGAGIEVVSPQQYYDMRPSVTVVFAWRYADAIIAKHKSRLPRGHRFIVPLPEVRVIEG